MSSKSIIGVVIGVIVVIIVVVAIAHHAATPAVSSKNIPTGFPGSTATVSTTTPQNRQPNNYATLPAGVLPPGPPPGANVRFTH